MSVKESSLSLLSLQRHQCCFKQKKRGRVRTFSSVVQSTCQSANEGIKQGLDYWSTQVTIVVYKITLKKHPEEEPIGSESDS